nr:hypothetical protein [uncultured Methanobrevibacter sp.]
MDQFYQELRKVQKKERNNGTLARVEETFYSDMHEYMDMLKQEAMNDPFSKAPAILKEAQIIATEICERREHKITDAAVVNIHRSYRLFTGKPQFDLVDTTPLNLTPEEEKFYYSLIDTLKNHRGNISLEKLSEEDKESSKSIIKPKETQTNTLTSQAVEDKSKSKRKEAVKEVKPAVREKPIVKPQVKNESVEGIEDNPNAFDNQEEFYDFETKKVAKETELVTMLVFDEVGAIVGVDEKVYGPFRPQDIVTLPLINAKIFFKNRKGRRVKI